MVCSPLFTMLLFILFSLSLLHFVTKADVPSSAQFTYVNQGDFVGYIAEYGADYRAIVGISTTPFQLCFYNTTPNAFTLAIRMGTHRSESIRRWVWEANRGNPVHENATLTLKKDGNLVLADADSRIAWQTNTANKNVVGLKMLSNGNIALYDKKGKFVWKSFDHPTDTLLVGQSFRPGIVTKLVSRASERNNSDGPYSLVMEPTRFVMYYKTPNSPKPYLYFSFEKIFSSEGGTFKSVVFNSAPEYGNTYAYELYLGYQLTTTDGGGAFILARPKYDATLTFLRLGIDGNLKLYTYNDNVDWGAWEVTFTLFDRESIWEDECHLPEKCGKFGLCDENQCVSCPLPKGFLGWTKNCEPPKPPPCGSKDFHYYKLEGIDHFMSKYANGEGPMKEDACGKKCNSDCKCLGYFYHKENSMCWISYDLKTLSRAENSSHVGYIKTIKR